jgi:hypothetical protein
LKGLDDEYHAPDKVGPDDTVVVGVVVVVVVVVVGTVVVAAVVVAVDVVVGVVPAGGELGAGAGAGPMMPEAADTATADPFLFEAVTAKRSVEPTSSSTGT